MTDQFSDYAKDLAAQNAPWAEGVKWWVVLIQGIALLGLGLYILFVPSAANKTIMQLLGIFLLIAGLLDTYRGMGDRVTREALGWHMFGAGAAVTAGIIVLLDMWQDFMSVQAGAVAVSVGLLLYGLTGLIIWIGGGERGSRSLLSLILPLGALLLGGVALFTRLEMGGDIVRWLGIISTVFGALLLVQTVVLYGRQSKAPEPVAVKQDDVAAQLNRAASDVADKIDETLE